MQPSHYAPAPHRNCNLAKFDEVFDFLRPSDYKSMQGHGKAPRNFELAQNISGQDLLQGESWSRHVVVGRNLSKEMVGACGFEPQTPTVSR